MVKPAGQPIPRDDDPHSTSSAAGASREGGSRSETPEKQPQDAGECLCVRCARHGKTCCQNSEVYVTPGDLHRMREYTGRDDFVEFRAPREAAFAVSGALRADGTRRILKRQPNGDCVFLGRRGCVLPLEVRPLVCRLYPYVYTEQGITGEFTPGCPVELLREGESLPEALQIDFEDAQRWHHQLYAEIRLEPHLRFQDSRAGDPDSEDRRDAAPSPGD